MAISISLGTTEVTALETNVENIREYSVRSFMAEKKLISSIRVAIR